METITIEFQSNIKEKLLAFLNSFQPHEVQIIEKPDAVIRDADYWAYRKKLHLEVEKINSGESKLHSLEELDEYLDKIISEYEN